MARVFTISKRVLVWVRIELFTNIVAELLHLLARLEALYLFPSDMLPALFLVHALLGALPNHVNQTLRTQGAKPIDGILGADFLMKKKIVINYGKRKLIL